MDVIPAIDLLDGKCVRLYKGNYDQSEIFHEDPLAIAMRWVEEGASLIHVVDLDGARVGKLINCSLIETIAKSVPIQVGGGMRDYDSVAQVLAMGVQRVILGTIAVEQPQLVASLCGEFPNQIVVGIDARQGKVAIKGWIEQTEHLKAIDLAKEMEQLGAAAIIYTDIDRDGTLSGPNIMALREIAASINIPVIASGGISSVRQLLSLLALEPMGVKGAIIGKALYTGQLSLKDAIQAVGNGRIQDIPLDFGDSSFA